MKMKNIILPLGTISVGIIPIATTVSCGYLNDGTDNTLAIGLTEGDKQVGNLVLKWDSMSVVYSITIYSDHLLTPNEKEAYVKQAAANWLINIDRLGLYENEIDEYQNMFNDLINNYPKYEGIVSNIVK